MLNTQPAEKRVRSYDGTLDVHSVFPTIQGEGPFAGWRALFIRLAGCSTRCDFCDTFYTEGRQRKKVQELVDTAIGTGHELIVITGGEPFRQPISDLVWQLYINNLVVQIETNGMLNPKKDFPHQACSIVVSPKAGKVAQGIADKAVAYKYVLKDGDAMNDGLPRSALGHPSHPYLARPPKNFDKHKIYLQPEDSQDVEQNKRNLNAAIQSCLEFGYTMSMQQHKIWGLD